MSSETLLEVRNLCKFFPITSGFFGKSKDKVHAVHDVSFTLNKGETLGIVGESGCGKSTLARTVLRLYEPDSGDILFNGVNISKTPMKELRPTRKDMQIIFQDPYSSLNPRMTILSILKEPFVIHRIGSEEEKMEKVDSLLSLVGLDEDAKDRYPHEFSGGQRQRIGIARALALQPSLIIADEPVSALDVSIQSQILNLLSELKEKFKLSYLFISHDLAVIEHMSDYVAVMYLGKIVEYSAVDELYKNPKHPYTKALIESIPIPEFNSTSRKKKAAISGDVPSPIHPPKGCSFHTRCPLAQEKCRKIEPKLLNYASDGKKHLAACHLI